MLLLCRIPIIEKGGDAQMAPHTILLADSSEEFLQELHRLLRQKYRLFSCSDGKHALELLCREKCDMIVLDLMLPGLDGITLLEQAAQAHLHPVILAVTPLLNDYVLRCADRLKIRYLVRKPCDVMAVASRVEDLLQTLPAPPAKPDEKQVAADLLLSLGLSPKHDGYNYLIEAICRYARDPNQAFTKVLYPSVGKVFRHNGGHVERSIRNALDAAWKRRDAALWDPYFPPSQTRPASAAVISRFAEEVRKLWE